MDRCIDLSVQTPRISIQNAYVSSLKQGHYDWKTTADFELFIAHNETDLKSCYSNCTLNGMPPNTVLFIMPETIHSDDIISPKADGYLIRFSMEIAHKANAVEVYKANGNLTIRGFFDKFEHEWSMQKPGYVLRCHSLLYQILDELRRKDEAPYINSQSYRLVAPAYEYIHSHYTDVKLTIDFLASICGITPQYFRKLFKQHFGIRPHEYINNLRMKLALDYLKSGQCSVSDAALKSGFDNASYFSRSFVLCYGYPPSKVLTQHRIIERG